MTAWRCTVSGAAERTGRIFFFAATGPAAYEWAERNEFHLL